MTRREALGTMAAAGAAAQSKTIEDGALERNQAAVQRLLEQQITDPASPWRGGYPDATGLVMPHSAGGIFGACAASYLHPRSRFHKDPELARRMKLAAEHLERAQTPDGNIDLLTTNFNSPPDTAFVVEGVATAALLAKRAGETGIAAMAEPFLRRAGAGMAKGGIHTPNHRWVVCAALTQLYELYGDPAFLKRVEQWLAEGPDLDADGQWTERSTTIYNIVCDRAWVTMADKLKRPALLEPVRRNLEAMLYLLHPGGEVVTELSRRQDRNERGDMGRYWFVLLYLAHHDRDGRFARLAAETAAANASLATLMEYPELLRPLPAPAPLPENFERQLQDPPVVRIRRGPVSATVFLKGNSRLLAVRRGAAVVNAVRFAAAFFGKGQFVPEASSGKWVLQQSLSAGYSQPFEPARRVAATEWYGNRAQRRVTELCKLDYTAAITERPNGFAVRLGAQGTAKVPWAIEINLREGGTLEGCTRLSENVYLLERGQARYRLGGDEIRFGPGSAPHRYVEVRGAEPKLPGLSVYLTGFTPVEQELLLEW